MSLYSALTQVLAPFAAKIKGIQTGYDGTVYPNPGTAVREQIKDLHVLIGDEPGTAISGSSIGYDGTDSGLSSTDMQSAVDEVADALSSTNERLDGLDIDVTTEKIVDGAVTWGKLAGGVKSRISANAGISEQAVTLLIGILRNALYSTNQSANIDLLEEALLSGNADVIFQSGETLTINALAIDPYQDGNVLNIE